MDAPPCVGCGWSSLAACLAVVTMDAPPCVGCGWCCLRDQCELSHRLHGYMPRCPELFWDDLQKRYLCRLALPDQPDAMRQAAQEELFLGQGCCAWHNPWRNNICNRDHEKGR